jgi:hypothetical protein
MEHHPMSKVLEYGYVAWTYVRGPFRFVVNFISDHPKSALAIAFASHVVRSWF